MSSVAHSSVPEDFLTDELLQLVRWVAKDYFLAGGDRDDLVQEGLIGAFKAVRDYDPATGVTFKHFAELCIRRNIITAVKTASRQKHRFLSQSLRVVKSDEGEDEYATDFIPDPRGGDPLVTLIQREEFADLADRINRLTPLERGATLRLAAGESYEDMADLGDTKSIDNALQRARCYLAGDDPHDRRGMSRGGERRLTSKKAPLPWE